MSKLLLRLNYSILLATVLTSIPLSLVASAGTRPVLDAAPPSSDVVAPPAVDATTGPTGGIVIVQPEVVQSVLSTAPAAGVTLLSPTTLDLSPSVILTIPAGGSSGSPSSSTVTVTPSEAATRISQYLGGTVNVNDFNAVGLTPPQQSLLQSLLQVNPNSAEPLSVQVQSSANGATLLVTSVATPTNTFTIEFTGAQGEVIQLVAVATGLIAAGADSATLETLQRRDSMARVAGVPVDKLVDLKIAMQGLIASWALPTAQVVPEQGILISSVQTSDLGLFAQQREVPRTVSLNTTTLNSAIDAYNALIADAPLPVLTALSKNSEFLAIGEILRELRVVLR